MRTRCSIALMTLLISGLLVPGIGLSQQETNAKQEAAVKQDIYAGYYARESNYGKMAQSSGNSHYVKFYPENRIARLYIPYPYSKSVSSEAINTAFSQAIKKSSGSAYIRDKFGVMEQPVVAHLDFFRWVDNQVMYDCGNASPCQVEFGDDSMIVIRPGVVLNHKIVYKLVSQ